MKTIRLTRFLQTFAARAGNYAPGAKGVNDLAPIPMEFEITPALAAGDTLELALPVGVDGGYVPVAYACWSAAAPQIPQKVPETATTLVLTSHDRATGKTLFTAGAAGVADKSVLSVLYIGATLGV